MLLAAQEAPVVVGEPAVLRAGRGRLLNAAQTVAHVVGVGRGRVRRVGLGLLLDLVQPARVRRSAPLTMSPRYSPASRKCPDRSPALVVCQPISSFHLL
jgi:hypothetical protein